jgi:hypothetical protein
MIFQVETILSAEIFEKVLSDINATRKSQNCFQVELPPTHPFSPLDTDADSSNENIYGAELWGLGIPWVQNILEDQLLALKCQNYRFRFIDRDFKLKKQGHLLKLALDEGILTPSRDIL